MLADHGAAVDEQSQRARIGAGLIDCALKNVPCSRLIEKYTPSRLPEESKAESKKLMEAEARRCGMPGPP